jgi:hypothetical protein
MIRTLTTQTNQASTYTVASAMLQNNFVSFEAFYDKYAAALYGEIKRSLYKDDVSQKVMEDAFKMIYQSLDTFDPAKEKVFISALKLVRKEISAKKVDIVLGQILYSKLYNQPQMAI